MVTSVSPMSASTIAAGSDSYLYVEGDGALTYDPVVLGELFRDLPVKVRATGGHENVRSLMQALARTEGPEARVYGIIDRDHRPDEEVESTWSPQLFPRGMPRLSIWRRHELENYFLEPALLARSRYLADQVTEETLRIELLEAAQGRVFIDAANLVIKEARSTLKWFDIPEIRIADASSSICNRATGQETLLRLDWESERARKEKVTREFLTERYESWCQLLLGSSAQVASDQGEWLARMAGKELLRLLMKPSLFRVPLRSGVAQGARLLHEVTIDLVKQMPELPETPGDFKEIRAFFQAM